MLPRYIVACVLVLFGMMIALGLVRLAANLVIFLICALSVAFALHQIQTGLWFAWQDIVIRSLMTGGLAALLTLPVLPLSSFVRRRIG